MYDVYDINWTTRTCVDAIGADCAKMGHVWERVEGTEVTPEQEALKQQMDMLFRHPNPDMTEHDLISALVKDLLIGADAYLEVVYEDLYARHNDGNEELIGKTPIELWPIEGLTMRIVPADETGRLPKPPETAYKQLTTGGAYTKFTADEIIHVSEGDIAGRLYGTPRLLTALVLIATQHMGIRYNLKIFTGQKYPKSMINMGGMRNLDELMRLAKRVKKQAVENPNGVVFTNADNASLLKLIDSNRDMEFLDLQKYIQMAICAVFRVPPIKIGISETGGAGIVVAHTQMQTHWDNVEEIQRQIAEELNLYFYHYHGLRAYQLKLLSGRPAMYSEEAVIEDMRIKNNSLTINEARADHGLPPLPWGDEPVVAAPAFSLPPDMGMQKQQLDMGVDPRVMLAMQQRDQPFVAVKGVAPGRMEEGALMDPETDKIKDKARSQLAGAWTRTRMEILDIFNSYDIIDREISKAARGKVLTREEFEAELRRIMEEYVAESDNIMATANADAYAAGRTQTIEDLEVEGELPAFSDPDAQRLATIQEVFAKQPIRTFAGDQQSLIQDTVSQAYASGETDLQKIRNLIEGQWRQLSVSEGYKLDRIARTSTHQANSEARNKAFQESGIEEVRFITRNDPPRVRKSHHKFHNQIIPRTQAMALLREVNCRCRVLKPSKRPATVPSPDSIAAAILESDNGKDARAQAREALGVE